MRITWPNSSVRLLLDFQPRPSGVEVMRTSTEPKLDIVRVTGLTGSQGWSAPQLVPTYVGKPLDGILDLQFIATMPEQTQAAEGFVPTLLDSAKELGLEG